MIIRPPKKKPLLPGRMQVQTGFELPNSSTWYKVNNMINSAAYDSTTTIVNNCLIVPATGSYTLTGGAVFNAGLGTQIARAVLQDGTILSADAAGSTPSVIPSVVVALNEGDEIRLEANSGTMYKTVNANINSYIQIVPV